MTGVEQKTGKIGQGQAQLALRRLGIEMVEGIGTPVRLVPRGTIQGRKVFDVIFGEKVSGDHRGILPGGRSVLAETKTVMDRNLRWSDLREHQPGRLDEHAGFGGLSLLVWVHSKGVYVMKWPVDGFGPGNGLTPEQAERISLTSIYNIIFSE